MSRIHVLSSLMFLALIGNVCYSKISPAGVGNIYDAVLGNLVDKYGSHDSLTVDELKAFIDQLTGAQPSLNETAFLKLSDACSSKGSKSKCRLEVNASCLDSYTISRLYGTQESNISLFNIFPALVYHGQSSVCKARQDETIHGTSHAKLSSAEVWSYGCGFVLLICIIANVGGCLIPFMKYRSFQRILTFCVALGSSVLACTGCLVLLPEGLELTGEESAVPNFHHKMAVILAGVYIFYLADVIKQTSGSLRNLKKPVDKEIQVNVEDIPTIGCSAGPIEVGNRALQGIYTIDLHDQEGSTAISTAKNGTTETLKKKSIAPTAWMILVGDSLHNFVDGMAIGAGFSENFSTGVSVSVAIFCEELPHELGDIAILLHSGMGIKRALCYNFMAALICFAGLVVGILLGEMTESTSWVLAFAGGMFVYISLVDMLPELSARVKEFIENGLDTAGVTIVLQNAGLLVGFLIMYSLVSYGEVIEELL